ncbi:hypothetical protein P3W45_000933 [Vairimorpha bombi]
MSVVQDIIKSLDKSTVFDKYRNLLKKNKKLHKKDYVDLQKIVRSKELYNILKIDLTNREARMLGNVFASVKLSHVDDIIHLICIKDDDNTPILLTSILSKKNKVDMTEVQSYLIKMIQRNIKLVHLELLHVVYKNYPSAVNKEILEFCKKNGHEICKEILSLEMEVLDESAICNGITILYTDGYPSALRKNRRGTSIEKESLKARYRTRKCIIKGRTPYLSKEAEKE